MKVEKYLLEKGFDPALKGFDFITKAVELFREDRAYKNYITSKLYPKLGELFGDEPRRIERAIRHSINVAGIKLKNSTFIALAEIETRN